jgi:hypothetical protein
MFDIAMGKSVCDREIWSRKRKRWEGCKRPAKIAIPSKRIPYMQMDFCCEQHRAAYSNGARSQ